MASPKGTPSLLSKVFRTDGKTSRRADHADDERTTSIELQEIPQSRSHDSTDSGICPGNKTLNSESGQELLLLTLLTQTDRLETGNWDESLIQAFDNANRTFVNTVAKLEGFLPVLLTLKDSTPERPEYSCDCEGCNLGRRGSLTIFQMRIRSLKHTYVFDVLALGGRVMFETEGKEGQSLKKSLQSQQIKVFWDVRQDSDAMFNHFGIRLGGIIDAQLMEIASRNCPERRTLFSLFFAVSNERKALMVDYEFWEWKQSFNKAKEYFNESNYECFNIRPLSYQALKYSAGDVDYIEKLYDVYYPKMKDKYWAFVREETGARIALSLSADMPKGSNVAPESISTIPYEWPIAKEWPKDSHERLESETSRVKFTMTATTNTVDANKIYEYSNSPWEILPAARKTASEIKEYRWGDPEPEWQTDVTW